MYLVILTYLDNEQNGHSVKVVGVVLEGQDLGEELFFSPLRSQNLYKSLNLANSSFSKSGMVIIDEYCKNLLSRSHILYCLILKALSPKSIHCK